MLIDNNISAYLLIFLITTLIVIFSIAIPIYGFKRKRIKGLALGCILQPIACVVTIFLIAAGICLYEINTIRQTRKKAMVTLHAVEDRPIGKTAFTWYLKPDDECFMEFMPIEKDKEKGKGITENYINENKNIEEIDQGRKYYDIIRLDSVSLGVEDRIVVRFDLKNRKVTATDDHKPIEVTQVDWEKVKAYLDK